MYKWEDIIILSSNSYVIILDIITLHDECCDLID
jgi:hypothetical protein